MSQRHTNATCANIASDAESSGGDIPSRKEVKSKKDKAAANQVQEELDDAQDSAAEDEFVHHLTLHHA